MFRRSPTRAPTRATRRVAPNKSSLFHAAVSASRANGAATAAWPFAAIKRGIETRCSNVHELTADARMRQRALGATDGESGLRFVSLMTHTNDDANEIEMMIYVSVFAGLRMNDARASAIDRRMVVASAYEEEGDLYIAASPKIVGDFEQRFFDEQLRMYLGDIRIAMGVLLESGARRSAAGRTLFRPDSDPRAGAFANEFHDDRRVA